MDKDNITLAYDNIIVVKDKIIKNKSNVTLFWDNIIIVENKVISGMEKIIQVDMWLSPT